MTRQRNTPRKAPALRLAAVLLTASALSGCGDTFSRLSEIGDGPKLTTTANPTARPDYRPVTMPMPAPEIIDENPNSLWRAGARAFFKDHRAKAVGDIITVKLNLNEKAKLENKTTRSRNDKEDSDVTKLLGLEAEFSKILPQAITPTSVASFGSASETEGDGTINRKEEVSFTMAAVVTQILPNGALVIMGRQEMRINNELREMMVTGVIRPEDISSDNVITHDKIAEMRVAYGGRGTLSELQRPRWGTQLWDIVFPF